MRVCSVCGRCYDDSVTFCTEELHPALSEARDDGDLEMIDGYRMEYLLESRANIEIYRAFQTSSRQPCLVSISHSDEKNSGDFLRDAKLAATLFHPSLVDIYDAGELPSGGCYVVTEDADGRTLREFLNDVGPPELQTSIEIVRQTAEALHIVHLSGLSHGAIRPENIVLTTDHERRLLVRIQNPDFGGVIARSIVSNKFLIDSALRSLRYFAPEQCSGERINARGDIYSLGIVFYEMLAGAPPFDAPKAAGLIEKHRNRSVPEIRIDNFELRMLVTHSLMESLQKQPRTRQSSANVLARQLRHIEQLATHVSTPPPAGVVPKQPVPVRSEPVRPVVSTPSIVEQPPVVAMRAEEAPAQLSLESKRNEIPVTEIEREIVATITADVEPVAVSELPVIENNQPQESEIREFREPIAQPIPALKSIFLTPRSRLMRWKKKLHSIAARLTPEISSARPASIVEPAERKSPDQTPVELSPFQEKGLDADRGKIQWETPENDVPSQADVLEVLAKEGVTQSVTITTASKEVAFETPIAIVAKGEAVEASVTVNDEPVEPPVALEALVAAKLAARKALEAPVTIATPVAIETPAVIERPVVIETPSVIEKPVVIETPVALKASIAEPEEKAIEIPAPKKPAPEKVTPAPVPRVTPKEHAPEPALVGSARLVPRMTADKVHPKIEARKASPKKSGLGFPVNFADLEEITLVRPPAKRIRIDWERAVPWPSPANLKPAGRPPVTARDIVFSPTILGAKPKGPIVETKQQDGMFSTYSDTPGSKMSGRSRSVMLGAGIVALLVLFLFGNDSVTKYFQTWSSADSVTADAISKREIPPTSASSTKPAKQRAIKNSAKPALENAAIKRSTGPGSQTSNTPNLGKRTVVPTALVAPAANKKKKATVEPVKKSIERKSAKAPDKVTPSTRPRIVNTRP